MKCPGSDMRRLKSSFHPCPNCSKPVEFFSDEMRVRCPHCKTIVYKEAAPSCIQWCSAARECLGPELYDAIMGKLADDAEK